ncbi:hypothetical protein BH11PLA2_BH11PLA2_10950 [soil metagenome]
MTPLVLLSLALAAEPASTPFFNGKDLTGWAQVNCAPSTFYVKEDQIITTGRPTGYLRTDKQYENFVLEFEWMHTRPTGAANSGMFVWGDALPAVGVGYTRSIEVQVLVNYETDWATSHGDLFSIWGAKCKPDRPHPKGMERCLPSERRCKGPLEWNHYKVTGNNGVLKLEVNGKEVSGLTECSPRKGYIALESEGSECIFKNFKMKELQSTNPKPEEIATLDTGFKTLFDGMTLDGWVTEDKAWKPGDGSLKAVKAADLTTAKALPAGELLFDWKLAKDATETLKVRNGDVTKEVKVNEKEKAGAGGYRRATVAVVAGDVAFVPPVGTDLRSIFFKPAK